MQDHKIKQRIKRISSVADAIGKQYSATRLSAIAMNTINLSDRDFEKLAAHMENNSRFLPLPPDWQRATSELRLKAESRIYDNCDYCGGKGRAEAIFLGSLYKDDWDGGEWPEEVRANVKDKLFYLKRRDAMGNVWPVVHSIRCKCNAGANITGGSRYDSFYSNYYRLLKTSELSKVERIVEILLKDNLEKE